MRTTEPTWCIHHEPDHEGALLHTHPVGPTAGGLGQITVERYDLPPGFEGKPEPADYIWLPFGEGIEMTEDEARTHVALVLRAIEVLAAARHRREAAA